ncbi:MAG: hypothetical protein SGBAC_005002 [Bacillariaceae sp.]
MKDCTNTFYSPISKSHDDRKRRILDSPRSSSPKPISSDNNATPSQTDAMIFEVTPTASPPSKRRRVRFDASVHVQYAEEALSDKADKALAATAIAQQKNTVFWYSRKEIEACRVEVVTMLKRRDREGVTTTGGSSPSTTSVFRSSSSTRMEEDGHDMSFRGVEDLLSKRAFQDRKKRKRVVVEKVLTEQARQVALKIADPEGLGMKSQLASKSSRDLALNRGSRDAMMAYIY